MSVNLQKGSTISLEKEAPGLTKVVLGTGWGKRSKKGLFGTKLVDVDLDASCLFFDASGKALDAVWFRQLRSNDGSVLHSGDDLTGGGGADDPNEEILVNLSAVSPNATSLVFTINSFTGDSFEGIPNAFCVLKNADGGKEIARYNLSNEGGNSTALIIAKLYKHNNEWKFKALGEWGQGRTFDNLMPKIVPLL